MKRAQIVFTCLVDEMVLVFTDSQLWLGYILDAIISDFYRQFLQHRCTRHCEAQIACYMGACSAPIGI